MKFWKNGEVPKAPYYAVIFVSEKSNQLEGYAAMDELTLKLAVEQEGFLGYESVNNGNTGIFISYWQSPEAIDNWRKNEIHKQAKSGGIHWYNRYLSQICKVEYSNEYINPQNQPV